MFRLLRSLLPAACCLLFMAATHRTPNFVVTAADPQYAETVAQTAEAWRRELAKFWVGQELPQWSAPCRTTVKINPRAVSAGGATQFTIAGGEVFGWGMTVEGTAQGILDCALPHEIAHTILVCKYRDRVPRWADEGAAMFCETSAERARQRKILIECLRTGRGIAFNRMFALEDYPRDYAPFYAQGCSLAEFLVAHGGQRTFIEFVGDGMRTRQWSAATQRHYGYRDLAELQTTWLSWVKAGFPELRTVARPACAPRFVPGRGWVPCCPEQPDDKGPTRWEPSAPLMPRGDSPPLSVSPSPTPLPSACTPATTLPMTSAPIPPLVATPGPTIYIPGPVADPAPVTVPGPLVPVAPKPRAEPLPGPSPLPIPPRAAPLPDPAPAVPAAPSGTIPPAPAPVEQGGRGKAEGGRDESTLFAALYRLVGSIERRTASPGAGGPSVLLTILAGLGISIPGGGAAVWAAWLLARALRAKAEGGRAKAEGSGQPATGSGQQPAPSNPQSPVPNPAPLAPTPVDSGCHEKLKAAQQRIASLESDLGAASQKYVPVEADDWLRAFRQGMAQTVKVYPDAAPAFAHLEDTARQVQHGLATQRKSGL